MDWNGIVPLDAFEREYRSRGRRADGGSSRNSNLSENKINCIFIRFASLKQRAQISRQDR